MSYRCIQHHQDTFLTTVRGQIRTVSTSGFSLWRRRPESSRRRATQRLRGESQAVPHRRRQP